MVRLDRIYTKSGDKGKTSLGNGQRLMKHHPRIAAIGDVDELNAYLGVVVCATQQCHSRESGNPDEQHDFLGSPFQGNDTVSELLSKIQNDLFDVGADLCMPDAKTITITKDYVTRLEQAIDHYNAHLAPLKSFVLPGGTSAAAHLHVARTICRRAERSITLMAEQDTLNPHLLSYINRLSDLLFVLARYANAGNDILWEPQKWKTVT